MEGSSAFDGGRVLKAGWLAFGGLMLATPVVAQPSDPLAPLPTSPAPAPTSSQPVIPAVTQPVPPTAPTVPVPRNWREVFDAIDDGNWTSAQLGISALPLGVLTPVAKAELYTAKGSPAVDLTSLQALITEAPELPQADQLARMAYARGATAAPLIIPER